MADAGLTAYHAWVIAEADVMDGIAPEEDNGVTRTELNLLEKRGYLRWVTKAGVWVATDSGKGAVRDYLAREVCPVK